MPAGALARYCSRCGTRLARDNGGMLCGACERSARNALLRPPKVSPSFWQVDEMRDALAARHMGRVIRAYRTHPYHGGRLRQETVGNWLGVTQTQLSRIENGSGPDELSKLIRYAEILDVPASLLWFDLPQRSDTTSSPPGPLRSRQEAVVRLAPGRRLEIDDMERRELLQRLSLVGALAAMPRAASPVGSSAPDRSPAGSAVAAANAGQDTNAELWRAFRGAPCKAAVFPQVRDHLQSLTTAADQVRAPGTRQRLCAAIGDVAQLAGEIFFDAEHHDDAVQCYTVAGSASREAGLPDQWACALTRHAFVCLAQGRPAAARNLLDTAADVARHGDTSLGTRYWVDAVQAQALAGLGDADGCSRAFGAAEGVQGLSDPGDRIGWLRFDGSRLAEERGTCLLMLDRTDAAESALLDALPQTSSGRRRGTVLVNLATVGVLRRDADQLAAYTYAALDMLRQTGSGYVGSRLRALRLAMRPHLADPLVRSVDDAVAAAVA